MTSDILIHLLTRFLHVGSVTLLLGGVVYARLVLVPTLNELPEATRVSAATATQMRFRNTLWTLLALIFVSGLYNFLTYSGPRHTSAYHMWFGIKFLLALHIFASAILWSTSPYGDVMVGAKGKNRLLSISISGLVVVLISAYLRSLSQRGL